MEKQFSHLPQAVSDISFLWFNKDIRINNKPFHFQDFLKENINFVKQLCKPSGTFKSWSEIKTKHYLEERKFYKWFQLYHAIPNQWKRIIKTINDLCTKIVYLNHHFVKNNRIVALEKLHSKEIYPFIIFQNMSTPASQQHFNSLLPHLNLDWKLIYLLPRILTKNTSLRGFQYKVLNNVFYLNHKLFHNNEFAQLFCNRIVTSIMKLYIFSALASELFHCGQKS